LIVADASAVLEMLLNTDAGVEVARRLLSDGQTIHVPHLIDIEILHALRRLDRTAEASKHRIDQAIQDYFDTPLQRYPHSILAQRIWSLRRNWTAYDAAYIALAEELRAPLLTCDRAMASGTGHQTTVFVI
jgi:predicted nucleic acid-binding protein